MPFSALEFKIVVVGGGSGSSVLLRGLKRYTSNITAIVTMFDSGGSTGLLRREFGYPPLGDLRQCLLALGEENEMTRGLRSAIDFRFSDNSSLNGHNVGNLMLAALTTLEDDVQGAIDEMSRMLRLQGQVLPVTLEHADLCAELEGGRVVHSEAEIDLRAEESPRINRVFLDHEVMANDRAVDAILEADVVVLGPGDLYTSIIPNLLAKGIPEALRETDATLIYVCNLMTKRGETDGYAASDFAAAIVQYMGGRKLDWVVGNSQPIPKVVLRTYHEEHASPVVVNEKDLERYTHRVMTAPLSVVSPKVRHDPDRLAESIASIQVMAGPVANGPEAFEPLQIARSAGAGD